MEPLDIVIIEVIVIILAAAAFYIYKAKKSGKKCIGCPDSCSCGSKTKENSCGGCCCGCTETKDELN